MSNVAIIGAGLAGLECATKLLGTKANVTIFEKARGPSGRISTRRIGNDGDFYFDHGAQYFTVKDKRFQESVNAWLSNGVVQEWTGNIKVVDNGNVSDTSSHDMKRYVGIPGINK